MSPMRTARYNSSKITVKIQRNEWESTIEAVCDNCSFYTILNVCPKEVKMKKCDFFLDKGTEIIKGKVITKDMYFDGKLTKEKIIFIEDYPENIIGWHQLKDMGLLKVPTNNRHVIDVPPVNLEKAPKPCFSRELHLKDQLIGDAKSVIASWERKGIIEKCYSVCNSPVTLTLKPNGKVKIIFKYGELNKSESSKSTGWEESLHEVISGIKLGKFYSVLTLYYGEWQIPLDTNTKYKTAFTFLGKKYVWNRLPGKYCKTPEILTKTLRKILDKLPPSVREHIHFFRDSMLISALTKKECCQFTEQLRSHLEESGFEVKENDKTICKQEVQYLGFEISPEGIRLGQNFLEKVQDIISPTSARELKRILGILEQARRLTPGFGVLASILHSLVNKKDWFWDEMHQKALDDLKRHVMKNRLAVLGLSKNETCIVEVFVNNNNWMAEFYNSARKPYRSASGTLKSVKKPQSLAVKELKVIKAAWSTMKKELKDREIIWEVQSQELVFYQKDPNSVKVNKSLDLSFLFTPKPQHKIKVVDPSSQNPPIPWPEY